MQRPWMVLLAAVTLVAALPPTVRGQERGCWSMRVKLRGVETRPAGCGRKPQTTVFVALHTAEKLPLELKR